MRKLLLLIVLFFSVTLFSLTQPAFAGDAASGAKVFTANCAACHQGGKNVVNAAKTLQKADLEKNSMNSIEAIVTQVTKGKNAMPAFAGRISTDDIENVAAYVLAQSEGGWK
ncbi:cytochrome c6 PetJ [Chroococcus sp. FPU101]|uniref:cytochrome c6 PetJ n=1 Tax=Chroococcus sp. FPU101 TaxID=1974212 RepID=UPI001A8F5BA3|nr:c-type cytochrome [Chroococcus sp. FPU101]GFE71962.1 cytochrome c, class I [Chroococcus sp. FPU101]